MSVVCGFWPVRISGCSTNVSPFYGLPGEASGADDQLSFPGDRDGHLQSKLVGLPASPLWIHTTSGA
jgi:hypothetical protein